MKLSDYTKKVQKRFDSAIRGLLKLVHIDHCPAQGSGKMYSFEGDTMKTRKTFTKKLQTLYGDVCADIKEGVVSSWQTEETLVGIHNIQAMNAFMNRVENGMNLSDRVWKYTNQLRDEMEMAITVSVAEGKSAQELSRSVRRYLKNPDIMFRRFRYKDDNGNWCRKWKQKYVLPNGTSRWRDRDISDFKPGQGVYRSSAKNAIRLASTEINMAYRNSDYQLWQSRNDIIGIEVKISNHANYKQRAKGEQGHKPDICDKLTGVYPKEFLFEGWHPNCHCIAVPIFIPPTEQQAYEESIKNGTRYVSPSKITQLPAGFKDYLATQSNGNEYFIQHNNAIIQRTISNMDIVHGQTKAPLRKENETFEQLKERLGNSIPKTLSEIDNAIKGYTDCSSTLRKQATKLEETMKRLFKDNDFGMDIDAEKLESVYKKGFLNKMELNSTNGEVNSIDKWGNCRARLTVSHQMFLPSTKSEIKKYETTPIYEGEQLKPSEYEKYGYIVSHDKNNFNSACRYGNSTIRFKKDKVLTTWTIDDSLYGKLYQPSLTSDPKVESFDSEDAMAKNLLSMTKNGDYTFSSNKAYEVGNRYIELQYHGQLTIDDVESVVLYKDPSKILSKDLIKRLNEKGIELWYHTDGAFSPVKRYVVNTQK